MKSSSLGTPAIVDDDRIFLGFCLEMCLPEVEELSAHSADHLRRAIGHLRNPALGASPAFLNAGPPSPALISYLRYLLPELDHASPSAAEAVRQALLFLDPARLVRPAGLSRSLH